MSSLERRVSSGGTRRIGSSGMRAKSTQTTKPAPMPCATAPGWKENDNCSAELEPMKRGASDWIQTPSAAPASEPSTPSATAWMR